jgi:hypothetical protein
VHLAITRTRGHRAGTSLGRGLATVLHVDLAMIVGGHQRNGS